MPGQQEDAFDKFADAVYKDGMKIVKTVKIIY